MSGAPYNGYPWHVRLRILAEYKRRQVEEKFRLERRPCDLCGDPSCEPGSWHSEDYSEPYLFTPPASYVVCRACHARIHRRFHQPPEDWLLFLEHIRCGGYGREFSGQHSLIQRRLWADDLRLGAPVSIPMRRRRSIIGPPWWERLTLDPESLIAAWARPRPLRPRPPPEAYQAALCCIKPSSDEIALLRAHALSPKRSASMRQIMRAVPMFRSVRRVAGVYGDLAQRLCVALDWKPDKGREGAPIWLSVVAEGWQPDRRGRETEWVMVSPLASLFV